MNFYWIYDLPNWQFLLICITVFIGFALLGTFFFNRTLITKLSLTVEHNSIVSNFLASSGVFYGITLGLIAVGTFENFNSVESIVNNESSSLAGLYRDVQILEGPDKEKMLKTLKNYTTYIVDTTWPLQSRGIIPKNEIEIINSFQKELSLYEPLNDKDKLIFAELFKQYNILIEDRRLRLNSVNASLPSSIWVILFLGAFVNIALTWCLVINNKKLEIVMNILSGLLIGSLIFLIASMDNPFRGNFSVSSQSFQSLLDDLMK